MYTKDWRSKYRSSLNFTEIAVGSDELVLLKEFRPSCLLGIDTIQNCFVPWRMDDDTLIIKPIVDGVFHFLIFVSSKD